MAFKLGGLGWGFWAMLLLACVLGVVLGVYSDSDPYPHSLGGVNHGLTVDIPGPPLQGVPPPRPKREPKPVDPAVIEQMFEALENAKSRSEPAQRTVGKPLAAALSRTLELYAAGDASGLLKIASGPDRRLMWATKDSGDRKQVENMKRFGLAMKKITPRWRMPSKGVAIASFGPVSKAYHFRFVRKNDAWLLDDVNGGD